MIYFYFISIQHIWKISVHGELCQVGPALLSCQFQSCNQLHYLHLPSSVFPPLWLLDVLHLCPVIVLPLCLYINPPSHAHLHLGCWAVVVHVCSLVLAMFCWPWCTAELCSVCCCVCLVKHFIVRTSSKTKLIGFWSTYTDLWTSLCFDPVTITSRKRRNVRYLSCLGKQINRTN